MAELANNFKMMKIFDCQDMPHDIMKLFFSRYDDGQTGNNCYADWTTEVWDMNDPFLEVSKWLVENGAEVDEEVIVKHWW